MAFTREAISKRYRPTRLAWSRPTTGVILALTAFGAPLTDYTIAADAGCEHFRARREGAAEILGGFNFRSRSLGCRRGLDNLRHVLFDLLEALVTAEDVFHF